MWLLGERGSALDINVPTEQELERLVTLHGWEALGSLVEMITDEKKFRTLVKCGVPFIEAAKLIGLREVRSNDPTT
jgi:hypothetical protein